MRPAPSSVNLSARQSQTHSRSPVYHLSLPSPFTLTHLKVMPSFSDEVSEDVLQTCEYASESHRYCDVVENSVFARPRRSLHELQSRPSLSSFFALLLSTSSSRRPSPATGINNLARNNQLHWLTDSWDDSATGTQPVQAGTSDAQPTHSEVASPQPVRPVAPTPPEVPSRPPTPVVPYNPEVMLTREPVYDSGSSDGQSALDYQPSDAPSSDFLPVERCGELRWRCISAQATLALERNLAIGDRDAAYAHAHALNLRVEQLENENQDLVRRLRDLELRCNDAMDIVDRTDHVIGGFFDLASTVNHFYGYPPYGYPPPPPEPDHFASPPSWPTHHDDHVPAESAAVPNTDSPAVVSATEATEPLVAHAYSGITAACLAQHVYSLIDDAVIEAASTPGYSVASVASSSTGSSDGSDGYSPSSDESEVHTDSDSDFEEAIYTWIAEEDAGREWIKELVYGIEDDID